MSKKIKIWHISDTHGYHDLLDIPKADIVIFTGDAANVRNPHENYNEIIKFIHWFKNLPFKYKIYIAGNHDTSIEKNLIKKLDFTNAGIIYLENDYVSIPLYKLYPLLYSKLEKLRIWGSPFTPTYGMWSFQKSRNTISRIWDNIPEGMDIIAVHGPCKGILDLGYTSHRDLERCGDSALKKKIFKLQPKAFLSGHIHPNKDLENAGTRKVANIKTIFSNGAVIEDGKFGLLHNNGNIIKIKIDGSS